MSATVDRLKSEMQTLSEEERVELATFLLGSFDNGEEDLDVEVAWAAELARREVEIDSGKAIGKPAAQVFAELREKYS